MAFEENLNDTAAPETEVTTSDALSYESGVFDSTAVRVESGESISLGNRQTLDGLGTDQSATFSFWYKPYSVHADQVIFGNKSWDSATNAGLVFAYDYNDGNPTHVSGSIGPGNGDYGQTSYIRFRGLEKDGWNMLTLKVDRETGSYTTYVNGIPYASGALHENATLTSGSPYTIGGSGLDFAMDNLRVWNRALSDEEIASVYGVDLKGEQPSDGGGQGGGGSVTTKYALTFDTNGGSAIAKVTKAKGTTVDLGQYVPTREGCTFAGWYSDEALTQKVTSVKLTANTTVYAKWTENAVTPTLPFADVKSGDWFYEAVQYVYDKGMMTGVEADRFAPASTTTRGMIVTILYRLENEPAVSGGSAFTDVESGAWYANAVAWAAANDIVNGTSATTFAPNSPITREQMAAILYRYAAYKGYDVSQKADLSGYTDASSISGYAKDALAWANAQKLITGVTDTTLNPQGSATRAQVAQMLMNFGQSY